MIFTHKLLPQIDSTPMIETDFYHWLQLFGNAKGNFNNREYQIYSCRPLAIYKYLIGLGFIKGFHELSEDNLKALKYVFEFNFDLNYKSQSLKEDKSNDTIHNKIQS
jgi:hypothetical protein